jgi:3-hydroxy-9,10-secoandrosta-1,3,5(10)-triene-9,17-dione monooxygenase
MAARALEYVIERAPEKGIAQTTYQPQTSSTGFQASVGNASMLIETAQLQAYSAAEIIDEAARDGRALSAVEQARLRMCAAHAAESLVKSVDLLSVGETPAGRIHSHVAACVAWCGSDGDV